MLNNLHLATEFGTGQVLWSFVWFTLFFIWIWLLISVFADILRNKETSGWVKTIWLFFIIFLPYLGVFVYIIANGRKMNERAVQQIKEQQDYIREVAGSGSIADELKNLSDLHAQGGISDDEYAKAKAKIIG